MMKIWSKWKHVGMVMVGLLLLISSPYPVPQEAEAIGNGNVESVYTDKSRYHPGASVTITSVIHNDTGANWSGSVDLTIYHLETQVYTDSQNVTVNAGQSLEVDFSWTTPVTDFRGYFVAIDAGSMGSGATAIDVSSDFSKYPRYGYISEFPTSENAADSAAKVEELSRKYHINAWQLYDWMWRHETMIKRTGGTIDSTWQDLFGRTLSWDTINNQIDAVHDVNGKAMAYAMIYAARENYSGYGVNSSWGIYEDAGASNQFDVDFGDGSTYLWLFDPQNTNWQNFIHAEYLDAVNSAGFDGIHVDQMGERNGVYDASGNPIDLSQRFTPFLDEAKSDLTANNASQDYLTFNIVDGTVNGWAANDVSSNADIDFLYSEIWFKSDTYQQLKNYIESIRENSGNKAVVLAAYMNYAENIGPRYEAEDADLTQVAIDTDHSGYTGTGFVDQFADVGDEVEFDITVPEDGKYSLVFRYANSTGGNSTLNLYVDGNFTEELYFFNQASWGTWAHDAWYQLELTAGNHTIRLAHDSGNTGAINLDSLTLGTFDEHSIRLADAMMSASGATHIELGEDSQMLAHEYYPNRSKSMRSSLQEAMQDHYNFITAYENLLFDGDVVTNDAGNQFIDISGVATSGSGADNTVWHIQKRTPDYHIVHLINLLNNDDEWRNSANQPVFKSNLATKIYIGDNETISHVYVASPDLNHGETEELTFTSGTDSNGKYVSFTLPDLKYWDMIYMDKSFTAPTDDIYEAENAIKTNTGTNTNHTGYTGSGFVDGFYSTGDGVSFTVEADTEDDYVLRFRYANGGSDATRDVYVNGKYAGTLQMDSTGSWGTWGYSELTASLKPGYHHVVIWQNSSNSGAVNLDHLDLDKTYVWQFDRQITSVPAGYRITFRTGAFGWVHQGVNNWQNVVDVQMMPNGSADVDLDHEISVGPFSSGTDVDFTFLWDDNENGVFESSVDRWEGTDFQISVD